MARVLKDGSLSGRVGNMVYYQLNGESYVKAYKKSVDPNTPKQQVQRGRMRIIHRFLSQFREVLVIGYQGADPKIGRYNEAVSFNMMNAIVITPLPGNKPLIHIDLELVKLTRGFILQPQITSCERVGSELTFTWNQKLQSDYNRHSDKLAIVAYTPGLPPVVDFNVGLRMTGNGKLILPENYNEAVHLWAFYHNTHGSAKQGKENVSDCVYLGEFGETSSKAKG